jgi:PAS domain S-box-containing protein
MATPISHSLANTPAMLQLTIEMADIAVWRHDLATNRFEYNERSYEVLGVPYRPGGLTLEEVRAHVHPDDLHRVVASAEQALLTDKPQDVEARYLRADGAWRSVMTRRVVERDAAGRAIAFVGLSMDVTERVEPSRRAEQLALRLEAAAQAARMGIWATTIGTDLAEWNAQMYVLFDRVGEAQPPTRAQWLEQCVHPDDRARVGKAARDYVRRKEGAFEIEFRICHRDGRTRWIVMRADIDRSRPDATRLFGIVMDVTDRREALAEAHAASERAALIARHAGIGTWENHKLGHPERWDEQMFRLRGLEPAAFAPDRITRLALVHPDDRAGLLDSDGGLTAGTQPTAYEFRVRLPDGSYRWLASRSAALCDEHGQLLKRVGVNWDITEAKNAEHARQQAVLAERESRAKSQFLSRMSHELRTPLNAVLGFTQLLQVEAQRAPDAGLAAKLDHIRAAGEHLLALVNDALDLSSLEAGTLKLELRPVPIAQLVEQTLPRVSVLAAARQVSVHSAAQGGVALADPTRLAQVLHNLLTNAIRYNRPGGRVLVECAPSGDASVRLRVSDTGRGIDAQRLPHLFEPFNRLGAERDGTAGTGIGLAIVKALVEGMGGRIEATSEIGHGTAFEITLAAAAPTARAGDASPRTRTGQVLYIEDNSVNVMLVEELVKNVPGLRIASESTGAGGVACARRLCPDVILIDMQLPDFDGFEVLRQLRAQPETARIPCIALSANALPEDIARGLAGGFDDYWTKPIKFKPFLDALERLFPA